ncbi:MAG: hypothetical protein WAX04_00405 [Oscillospiraceae bacterium]
MYITITMELGEKCFDVQIDDLQTLNNGVEILKTSGKYMGHIVDFYRSRMQCGIVSGYQTFADAGICSGDVLTQI